MVSSNNVILSQAADTNNTDGHVPQERNS
jgi:hypothetical protein